MNTCLNWSMKCALWVALAVACVGCADDGGSEGSSVNNTANNAPNNTANNAPNNTANNTPNNTANNTPNNTANNTSNNAPNNTANNAPNNTANNAPNNDVPDAGDMMDAETPDAMEEPDVIVEDEPGEPDVEEPAGACVNTADEAALADNADELAGIIGGCVFECIGSEPSCVVGCMQREVGLTDECAGCFGETIQCTLENCPLQCIDPNSQGCIDCQAANCDDAFEACAGIAPRR